MEICQIGEHATAYIYEELADYQTIVVWIAGATRDFLLDTFCGPDSMIPIQTRCRQSQENHSLLVLNTHAHWDHYWGNCSFKGYDILSHELCRTQMAQLWEEQIQLHGKYCMGNVEKCLPNITFREKMYFPEDGIEIFHSPGHTIDSISVFDHREKILYVGDNLEKPIIHVEDSDITSYIQTLKNYLEYHPKRIVAGHTLALTEEDVTAAIQYLEGLAEDKVFAWETAFQEKIHQENRRITHPEINGKGS